MTMQEQTATHNRSATHCMLAPAGLVLSDPFLRFGDEVHDPCSKPSLYRSLLFTTLPETGARSFVAAFPFTARKPYETRS